MKYIGLDDGLSIDKQVSNFNQLLARGANAIALYPLAPNALRASLAKAKRQGVAVVGFNVTFTKSAKATGYDAQIWEGRAARQGRDRRDRRAGARDQVPGPALPLLGEEVRAAGDRRAGQPDRRHS